MILKRAIFFTFILLAGCGNDNSPVVVCDQVFTYGIDTFSRIEKGEIEYFASELEKIESLPGVYKDCASYFSSIPNFGVNLFGAETKLLYLIDNYGAQLQSGGAIDDTQTIKVFSEEIKNSLVLARHQLSEFE